MGDELSAFESADDGQGPQAERPGESIELLVFLQGEALLGIEARWVDSVIPYRAPALLPLSAPAVAGVVQDRGRVVVVRKPQQEGPEPKRIIVCSTEQGLVGVPASATRAVGEVVVHPSVTFNEPVDTSEGVMTLLDPGALADDMTAT